MKLLDGKALANRLYESYRLFVSNQSSAPRQPTLAAILVDPQPASRLYVSNKERACQRVGIRSEVIEYTDQITTDELIFELIGMSETGLYDGVIVQLPMPAHIDRQAVLGAISSELDVDGFSPASQGALVLGLDGHRPATPAGILMLLDAYGLDVSGKVAVVVGRSEIVGTPLSILLSRPGRDATSILCHSKTPDLAHLTRQADFLFVAAGRPGLIGVEHVKKGAVVVDVGIHPTEGGGWVGDVRFDELRNHVSAITPVPGGVGPMTVCALVTNTLHAWCRRFGIEMETF
jgi:methylenetetrahydrofolate dehydrogenase (NADP+)/methenyltetrahydrofolate cyclohydrolase